MLHYESVEETEVPWRAPVQFLSKRQQFGIFRQKSGEYDDNYYSNTNEGMGKSRAKI